jgi:hypothetical protein
MEMGEQARRWTMKISSVEAVRLNQPKREMTTKPWRPHWTLGTEIATPMARFPELKANRGLWYPKWPTGRRRMGR